MNQHQTQETTADTEEAYYKQDGITHINTHTKSNKELGRMLSHYYEAPFVHPYFGRFKCIEGFWYYIRGGCKDDGFRNLDGYRSKQRAQKGAKNGTYEKRNVPHLKDVLLHANFYKIDQNEDIKKALIESTLPFDHYFVFGPGKLVIKPNGSDWLVDIFTELREVFRGNQKLEPFKYDYAELRKHDK